MRAGFDDSRRHPSLRRIFLLPAVLLLLLVVMPFFLEYAEDHWLKPHLDYFGEVVDSIITER